MNLLSRNRYGEGCKYFLFLIPDSFWEREAQIAVMEEGGGGGGGGMRIL